VLVALVAGAISSCDLLVIPGGPGGTSGNDESWQVIANAEPNDMSAEDYPLFAGARWAYRNGTADFNPEVHAGSLNERDVLGVVQRRAGPKMTALECYVLRIQDGVRPSIQLYLHRVGDEVQIYGIEALPYTGAPEFLACSGQALFELPMERGQVSDFTLADGTGLRSTVLAQEAVPRLSSAEGFPGPYSTGQPAAWRVVSEYEGILSDALGEGVEETWYVSGMGLVRRTAFSLVYELMEYRDHSDVLQLTEDSGQGSYNPPIESFVIVQLRVDEAAGSDWILENAAEVASSGVLSPLPQYGIAGVRLSDIGASGRLATGTHVFGYQVRTEGRSTLTFTRNGVSGAAPDRVVFEFGATQDSVLSEPSVATHVPYGRPATAVFSVHYFDADGDQPTVKQVCVNGRDCYEMRFVSGKLADGYYESDPIVMDEGIHRFCFRFSDRDDAEPVGIPCLLERTFDIGGPMPSSY